MGAGSSGRTQHFDGVMPRMIRIATLILALAVVGVSSIAASPIQAASFERQAYAFSDRAQPLLLIDQRVTARAHPSPRAGIVGRVETRTPLTGAPTVLPILQTARGPAGGRWLRVRLPMRPNSASGWVPADTGKVRTTRWRIVVHLDSHRALVLWNGKIPGQLSDRHRPPRDTDTTRRLLRRREDPRRSGRDRRPVGIGDLRVFQCAPRVRRRPRASRPSWHRRAQCASGDVGFSRLRPVRQ